jgi:hypothetical protein
MTPSEPVLGYGYAAPVKDFLASDDNTVLRRLEAHHGTLGPKRQPSGQQLNSWRLTIDLLRAALQEATRHMVGVDDWHLLLEYELPFEGGRRPDAIVLAGGVVVVIEFKDSPTMSSAHVDQVRAYARDLREYHSVAQRMVVEPVLLYPVDVRVVRDLGDVHVVGPSRLGDALVGLARGTQLDSRAFVEGAYAPLPTIVEAARRIFRDEPLPRLRRADSLGLEGTVHYVKDLITQTSRDGGRRLVLVAGVPGAGKTLAGLRTVYEGDTPSGGATFLSGNGPLVQVLQDALKSSVFVRDLHKFILEYGVKQRTPSQHVIVFDEAQRAWDRDMMLIKKQVDASEPELLVRAGDRVPGWCVLVGLVGDGQEIHSGEEGGLVQWSDAIEASPEPWQVHCPPRLSSTFAVQDVTTAKRLDLDRSMRSHRAEDLHLWVSYILGEELEIAADLGARLRDADFSVRLTRDLNEAKRYVTERYRDEPNALYGLLASSHAKNLTAQGIANDFQSTKRVKIHHWFNAEPEHPLSACALDQPATEFMCQGLELDMPLVCWGSDFLWNGRGWTTKAINRKIRLHDPDQIVRNTYRVLMTRGRDGLLLFVPPGAAFDDTAGALRAAGVDSVEEVAVRAAA